ncbi:MAG: AAA family ATPase [Pseudomonadota bacterium]
MLIELFGPPGCGKTTFAHALAQRMQTRGFTADVLLSYQPGTYRSPKDPAGLIYAAGRVSGAAVNLIAMTCMAAAKRRSFELAGKLIATLPPRNPVWLLRYGQYILRLADTWQHRSTDRIAIFDQAFVQAVCSLALLTRGADDLSLAHALNIIPVSDLIIRLDVPEAILSSRLEGRMKRESFMEKLFETDVGTSHRAVEIVDRLDLLLATRGRATMSFCPIDKLALEDALSRTEEEIMNKLQSTGGR